MTPAPLSRPVVRLERTIPAPPPLVYRAWLDPDPVARWMAPGSYEVTGVEIDERVGGRYRIRQANEGVDVGGFDCQILELVADRRIVWHWGFAGPGGPVYDSLMTVTLRAVTGGATALTLLHDSTSSPLRCPRWPTRWPQAGRTSFRSWPARRWRSVGELCGIPCCRGNVAQVRGGYPKESGAFAG
jgi:uncharacterized protein YndB with AHSA1/START domain